SADAQTQVPAGRVPIMFDAIPGVAAQIKAGKLRALGIASPERSPYFPDVPTIAEQGYPGFAAVGWIGMVAPARTPDAILDRLNAEVRRTIARPEVRERLAALSFFSVGDLPGPFAAHSRGGVARLATAVEGQGAEGGRVA